MLEIFSYLTAFLAAIFAARGHTWDDTKPGHLKYTWKGVATIIIATAAFIFSVGAAYYKNIEQQQQFANQQAHLGVSRETKDYVKEQLKVLDDHTKKLGETLDYAQRLTKRQEEQVQESQRISKELQEQLSLLSSLGEAQNRQRQLSQSLTAQQQEQVRRLREMRLDRDLIGVEISFEPSAQHWTDIASACDKIKPLSPGFPYSAATIMAERVGGYWDIDFSEIRNQQKGTIKPPSISTNLPENKTFEEIIDAALLELQIEWIGGDNSSGGMVSTLSGVSGTYPTSVMISKKKIAFVFRSPKLRLNLSDLRVNPTVKLRSRKLYPKYITFRSLDNRVMFNERIDLSWEEKRGESHAERWMPYVSGPHHLTIDWSRLLN